MQQRLMLRLQAGAALAASKSAEGCRQAEVVYGLMCMQAVIVPPAFINTGCKYVLKHVKGCFRATTLNANSKIHIQTPSRPSTQRSNLPPPLKPRRVFSACLLVLGVDPKTLVLQIHHVLAACDPDEKKLDSGILPQCRIWQDVCVHVDRIAHGKSQSQTPRPHGFVENRYMLYPPCSANSTA